MQKLKIGVKGIKDILTREEMRKIGGGLGSGSDEVCNCTSTADCQFGETCMSNCDRGNGYAGRCTGSN